MRTRSVLSIAALTAALLTFSIAPTEARAQTPWNGYAPTYAAPPSFPSAMRPPMVYAAPASPGGMQTGVPATTWLYYDPAVGWRPYTPAPGAVASAPAAAAPVQPIRRAARGYGTGHRTHLHRPWMPSRPR